MFSIVKVLIPYVCRNKNQMKYLTAICEESWKSLPVVDKFWGLALGSMLIPLVDSFTWFEVNLRAFVFAIILSDWIILKSYMSMLFRQTSEEVNVIDSGGFLAFKTSIVGSQWLFSSMLISSPNFRRISLRYAMALPIKYSFFSDSCHGVCYANWFADHHFW